MNERAVILTREAFWLVRLDCANSLSANQNAASTPPQPLDPMGVGQPIVKIRARSLLERIQSEGQKLFLKIQIKSLVK